MVKVKKAKRKISSKNYLEELYNAKKRDKLHLFIAVAVSVTILIYDPLDSEDLTFNFSIYSKYLFISSIILIILFTQIYAHSHLGEICRKLGLQKRGNLIFSDEHPVLFGVFIAPVWEELLFRYIILNRLTESYSEVNAIIITTIFFAIMHPLSNRSYRGIMTIIGASFYMIPMGFVLCKIYIESNSVVAAILLHSALNLEYFIGLRLTNDDEKSNWHFII